MIKIDDKSCCWCISGKPYDECCGKIIKSIPFEKRIAVIKKHIDNQEFDKALDIAIANLIDYLVKVKSHTEPIAFNNSSFSNILITIDINALSELIDYILSIINLANIDYKFDKLLAKAKNLFFNSSWHMKIDYYNIVWFAFYKDNINQAVNYITNNVKVNSIEDQSFLELIIDIYSDQLPFSDRINMIQRLISQIDQPILKVQYQIVEALIYFEFGDNQKTKNELEKISKICLKYEKDNLDSYELLIIARCYYLLGKLKMDYSYSQKAITVFNRIIDLNTLNNEGISEIFWFIGTAYFDMHQVDNAIENFDKSIEYFSKPQTQIDKAYVIMTTGDYQQSKAVLNQLNYDDLNEVNRKDYLNVYSNILFNDYDKEKIDFIISELHNCTFNTGIYKENALKLISNLYQIKEKNKTKLADAKSGIKNDVNGVLMLQPNFMGLGINFNNLFDLFRDKKKKKKKTMN